MKETRDKRMADFLRIRSFVVFFCFHNLCISLRDFLCCMSNQSLHESERKLHVARKRREEKGREGASSIETETTRDGQR